MWIGRPHAVKMSVLPNAIPGKVPASYFAGIDKPVLKFIWKDKKNRIAILILEEKNKVEELTLPEHCKATVIKTM